MLVPNFVDHLVFRVANIETTERFYTALLGPPLQEDDYIMYQAGETRLFFTPSRRPGEGRYDKENIV
jgi:catechol 2,3-dioxygenase-like lactoylglutathione lyase family enzyme